MVTHALALSTINNHFLQEKVLTSMHSVIIELTVFYYIFVGMRTTHQATGDTGCTGSIWAVLLHGIKTRKHPPEDANHPKSSLGEPRKDQGQKTCTKYSHNVAAHLRASTERLLTSALSCLTVTDLPRALPFTWHDPEESIILIRSFRRSVCSPRLGSTK